MGPQQGWTCIVIAWAEGWFCPHLTPYSEAAAYWAQQAEVHLETGAVPAAPPAREHPP